MKYSVARSEIFGWEDTEIKMALIHLDSHLFFILEPGNYGYYLYGKK